MRNLAWLIVLLMVIAVAAAWMNPPVPAPFSSTPSPLPPAARPTPRPSPVVEGPLQIVNIFYQKPNLVFHYVNRGGVKGGRMVKVSIDGGPERPLQLELEDPWRVSTSPPVNLREFGVKTDNFDVAVSIRGTGLAFSQVLSHRERTPMVTRSGKPDLVIDDVYYDGQNYFKVKYHNQGGAGSGDFLIRLSSGQSSFGGNYLSRFPVPEPGQPQETGGYTIGLIGLQKGDSGRVRAEIDWEQRVDEQDRSNNVWEGSLDLR
ncbi:MAG: hypothetical protein U0931_24680 [Vulcanimicrobiota bacterium]